MGGTEADVLIEAAVLRGAEELDLQAGGGGVDASQVAGAVGSLSMGAMGRHSFEGELAVAVGAGSLQDKAAAEKAVVEAGPLAVLRPPSAGTRDMYGWGMEGIIGQVRPLVDGEASMWDRHLRRVMLSGEDAAETMHRGCAALASVMRVFGRESAADGEGRRRWDGPRDQRWVPGDLRPIGGRVAIPPVDAALVIAQSNLPEGWTAFRAPSGSIKYEHTDGRMQSIRPTAEAALPAGWMELPGPGGASQYYHAATGRMQAERPTE